MGKAQREKGARGEREARDLLIKHGFSAKRHGRHFHGLEGHTHLDLEHDCKGLHIEVKYQERVNVWSWIDQAKQDAGEDEVPVVLFRKNRRPWYVIEDADTYFARLRELEDLGNSDRTTDP